MAEMRERNEESRRTRQTGQRRDYGDIERAQNERQDLERSRSEGSDLNLPSPMDFARNPFAVMNALRREMERMFEGFGGGLMRPQNAMRDLDRGFADFGSANWTPQIEVFEGDGKLHVSADLPGLDKDDVRIEVIDNDLIIEGERRSEQRDESGRWSERSYGRFYRSVPLPEGVNADTANASFENGVLDITFTAPKRRERQGKQIRIGGGIPGTKK